jgi:hypothetical protein
MYVVTESKEAAGNRTLYKPWFPSGPFVVDSPWLRYLVRKPRSAPLPHSLYHHLLCIDYRREERKSEHVRLDGEGVLGEIARNHGFLGIFALFVGLPIKSLIP